MSTKSKKFQMPERAPKSVKPANNWYVPVCPGCGEIVTNRQSARLVTVQYVPGGKTYLVPQHTNCR